MRTGSKISPFGDNNSLYCNLDMSKTIAKTAPNVLETTEEMRMILFWKQKILEKKISVSWYINSYIKQSFKKLD